MRAKKEIIEELKRCLEAREFYKENNLLESTESYFNEGFIDAMLFALHEEKGGVK